MKNQRQLLTIGHSNHSLDKFIELLRQHSVKRLVDVRTAPYSRFSPHFSKPELKRHLNGVGIEYFYLGDRLGGRPEDPACFDEAGALDYGRIARQPWFADGIAELIEHMSAKRTTIMCSEEDPGDCHRNLLISDYLLRHTDTSIHHIRGSGETQPASLQPKQTPLF
jgi:uncharacterized protein (DUF488 family)